MMICGSVLGGWCRCWCYCGEIIKTNVFKNNSNWFTNPHKNLFIPLIKSNRLFCTMDTDMKPAPPAPEIHEIKEGQAKIKNTGKVFYNPVQEFNRDLSICVLTAFIKKYEQEKLLKEKPKNDASTTKQTGAEYPGGIRILEALSATGLRSIRYAKEVQGIKEIIANDISDRAVENIKQNVAYNDVGHLVMPCKNDAVMLMYQYRRENQFDVIDLDPYGCPSVFLDSTVQAVKDGGLLLVTATDMGVLAGNSPETCYVKYGAVSLKMKSCHEMAVRILLQNIESHANRYGRYIVPLLSISADFYIRVFVRVYTGQFKCKYTTSKLSHVFHCTACDSYTLHPLGDFRGNEKKNQYTKFIIPKGPPVSLHCEQCNELNHMGGPIWSAPIHSPEFVDEVLLTAPESIATYKRLQGMLTMIKEELLDVPLYYGTDKLARILHIAMPPSIAIRSAILNAGYRVSYSHMYRNSIKTDAPTSVLWAIMTVWAKQRPLTQKQKEQGPANVILSKPCEKEYSFQQHPQANPESRKLNFQRFPENPLPNWGPGNKGTAMVGGNVGGGKKKRNQNKRKREMSEESR